MSAFRKLETVQILEWLEDLEHEGYGYWTGKSPEPGPYRHRLKIWRERDAFATDLLLGPSLAECVRQAKIAMGAPVIPLRTEPRFDPQKILQAAE